jgi:hypothetical protein
MALITLIAFWTCVGMTVGYMDKVEGILRPVTQDNTELVLGVPIRKRRLLSQTPFF